MSVQRWISKSGGGEWVNSAFGGQVIEGLRDGGFVQKIRSVTTDFGSPVDLGKAVFRAQRLYKQKLSSLFTKHGIDPSEVEWTVLPHISGQTANLDIMARHQGELLAGVSREFGKDWVELTSIEVGKRHRGGMGKAIYEAEPSILREMGYSEGTAISSPVVSPITARWQYSLYGSRAAPEELGAFGMEPTSFHKQLMSKQITKKEFPSIVMEGKLSGNDDAWNSISGLSDEGIASTLRKDFGSGWRGLVAVPRSLSEVFQRASQKAFLGGQKGTVLGTRLGSKHVDEVIDEMRTTLFSTNMANETTRSKYLNLLGKFENKLRETPFRSVAVLDPKAIAKDAEIKGFSFSSHLRSILRHERLHQGISQMNLGSEMRKVHMEMGRWLKTTRGATYQQVSPKDLNEEFLAGALETRELLRKGTAGFSPEGAKEAYSRAGIYGQATEYLNSLPSVNMMKLKNPEVYQKTKAAFKKRWYTAHRQAQVDIAKNSTGGRNHLRTGKRQ